MAARKTCPGNFMKNWRKNKTTKTHQSVVMRDHKKTRTVSLFGVTGITCTNTTDHYIGQILLEGWNQDKQHTQFYLSFILDLCPGTIIQDAMNGLMCPFKRISHCKPNSANLEVRLKELTRDFLPRSMAFRTGLQVCPMKCFILFSKKAWNTH